MNLFVKKTIKFGLLDLLCPHHCKGCGALGSVFCERCKKYLNEQRDLVGMVRKTSQQIDNLYAAGWRERLLARLVEDYKYQSVRSLKSGLVDLLDEVLPYWDKTVIVPLPTISRHVRERGFDHTWELARELGRRRGWEVRRLLGRARNTVQVGAKAGERQEMAQKAYKLVQEAKKDENYLLLDDVWTTGASMLAAEKLLKQAGANEVRAVVIAISN